MPDIVHGSCLCGDVTWEAQGPLDLVSHCHCSICRKHHGAAFGSHGGAPAASFRWRSGREGVRVYQSSPGFARPFCARCGSPLPVDPKPGDERVFVPLGLLDDDPGGRALAHIFVASKAPWHEIAGSLPRFDAYPPGFEAPVVADAPRDPPSPGKLRGSCLCGGVSYEIEGSPENFRNCHCGRCRKARSAAFATNFSVPLARIRWIRGEDRVAEYAVPGAKHFKSCFCETCGAKLPRFDPSRGFAVVPASSLDDDPGDGPLQHIFAASKADWFAIEDDLPRHDEYPPDS